MRNYEERPAILDISGLKSGMVVKGYRGMCEVLGVAPIERKGKSRTLQEEDWKRYFEWEELGYGYLRRITHIKEFPDVVPPPPNAVYVKLIEMMLVYKLAYHQSLEIEMTWPQLFVFLGMANEKFKNHGSESTYDHINQTIRHIKKIGYVDWGMRARSGFKRKLRTALNSMKRRQLVEWDEELYCVLDVTEESLDGTEERHKELHRVAGPQEKKVKTEASRYVLKEVYGADSEDEIISRGLYREYIDEVNDYLSANYKILKFYNKIRITYSYKNVMGAIEDTKNNLLKMADEFDFDVKVEELTEALIKMLNMEASSKHAGAIKKLECYPRDDDGERSSDLPDELTRFVYFESDDYILEQELFSQYFISRYSTDEELRKKYGNFDKTEEGCQSCDDNLDLILNS